ncbi:MAG TPA: S8 family serine peptidase [Candidatus Eisenbacteria bacterium]
MSLAPPAARNRPAWLAASLALALPLAWLAFWPSSAVAWADQDRNRIDDRIDAVHTQGFSAAFVDRDPSERMIIGVENPEDPIYAIYVAYDRRPTSADEALLLGSGATMAWPFQNIDYIESRATYVQIQEIVALPGVTHVEAIPVEYAINHYGTRVVRARDSRGLAKAENYALFPSVRQDLGYDGTGVVIAILDTGVNDDVDSVNPGYPGHESLKGKFLGGGEFWCGQPQCSTPTGGSSNPQDHGGEASSYHATHVAGTAMGTGGLGGFFAGVAPGARLVDCKVLSDAGASVGGSTRGVDWCISNRNRLWDGLHPGSIWQGIDVISMSLGSTECAGGSGTSTGTGASSLIVNQAVDAGMVVCIATGNDNATECIASPAAADKSIAVGASEHRRTLDRSDDVVTSFSNEGPRDDDGDADHLDEMKPSVVAPGAGIISAFGDPTTDGTAYQQLSGTSMATPCVSGCVALVLQANPSLTPLQVRTILQNTAEHNIPTAKASGDRGQDPYGLDANYDPSCGWGEVDVYAAVKEALNSTSGVQVVQIRAVARPQDGRIDVTWITQREYSFLGFNLYRAPDAGGAPGGFAKLNASLIPPSGDPAIQGDDNRTPYLYPDADPALVPGRTYWYRVEWVDLLSAAHPEPPVPADYGQLARVATVFYSLVHNTPDNDLTVRVGADLNYDPGALGQANFEVLGPGESKQDSAHVLLPTPPNTGTSTVGTIEHFWSLGFNAGDGAEAYLPPVRGQPWFLWVMDGGFVNRTGRVTGFSMFVNDSPGSASGTTYVTDHAPMPQPMVEGGEVPVTLWIPERDLVAVEVATLAAAAEEAGVRIVLELLRDEPGLTASIYRSLSSDFGTRVLLTPEPIAVSSPGLEYLDSGVVPGRTYTYWVQLHRMGGGSIWNGPVAASFTGAAATFAASPSPNPVRSRTRFEYSIGSDVARGGPVPVTLALHDLGGRLVRTLHEAREPAGRHAVDWDGTDRDGRRVEPGIYHLRFRAGPVTQSRRVTVIR